jgi:hypothetical protein
MLAAAAGLAVTLLILISGSRAPWARSPTTRIAPPADLSSLPDECPTDGERVVVIHKAKRALGLYVGGQLAAAYPIGLGPRPEGHKEREGDRRTPEDEYYVCTRNARSRFHLFLGISYPNHRDAAQALSEGHITQQQHDSVVGAMARRHQPP